MTPRDFQLGNKNERGKIGHGSARVKSFSILNLKYNKIYLLRDFNINLLQNGNYILNRKGMAACQGPVHILINKYQEFCQRFHLKQLITCPKRVTYNSSSLIDPPGGSCDCA